jgi:predicted nucleic acid-binding protein
LQREHHNEIRHAEYIDKKSNNSVEEVRLTIKELFDAADIQVFATPELKEVMGRAKEQCPDPNDKDYFALALKLGCPIWSNDKELKKQGSVKVYTTEEILNQES